MDPHPLDIAVWIVSVGAVLVFLGLVWGEYRRSREFEIPTGRKRLGVDR